MEVKRKGLLESDLYSTSHVIVFDYLVVSRCFAHCRSHITPSAYFHNLWPPEAKDRS